MFAMTLDQRSSQSGPDRVPDLLARLADLEPVLPFERSVGDELQGVLAGAGDVVEVALRALRTGHWYVGIGIGAIDSPLPASPREARGRALVAARRAVDRAKKTGDRVPLAVEVGPAGPRTAPGPRAAAPAASAASAAEAVLVLVGALVAGRTEAEWRVLDQLHVGLRGTQAQAAAVLGISAQAVSKAVLRSGWREEQGGRNAAAILLDLADN
ncbi:MarR family transcriptional regulator [Pseudarthrobacter sp. P1]|uniref:MarR family transcriptional regulator n=1 Tax=Pseudarthrobacter sp. P1 TaxID=3418418 RepID=UPI003CE6715C